MATAAAGKALAELRPDRRRHRPGRRRHLHLGRPDARTSPRRVAARLGITAPGAYDINTACSGFSLRAGAASTTPSGPARRATPSSSAPRSSPTSPTGPTAPPASSSATAPAPRWSPPSPTASRPASARCSGARCRRRATSSRIEGWRPYIQQEGQAVFRWATTALAPLAREACERAGVDPAELAAFVPHQANARIIDGIAKRLGLSPTRSIAKDIVESGNTSAASIPLALSKLVERREVPVGRPGSALRLRRRPHLRRSGRPLPVMTPRGATAPTAPSTAPPPECTPPEKEQPQ